MCASFPLTHTKFNKYAHSLSTCSIYSIKVPQRFIEPREMTEKSSNSVLRVPLATIANQTQHKGAGDTLRLKTWDHSDSLRFPILPFPGLHLTHTNMGMQNLIPPNMLQPSNGKSQHKNFNHALTSSLYEDSDHMAISAFVTFNHSIIHCSFLVGPPLIA